MNACLINALIYTLSFSSFNIISENSLKCMKYGFYPWNFSLGPRKIFANFYQGPDSKGLVHHMVCALTTQLCCHWAKAAMDCTQINDHDYVPIKLYLQKQAVGQI